MLAAERILANERVWVLVAVWVAAAIARMIMAAPVHESPRPDPQPTFRYVPLSGHSLSEVVEDAQQSGGACLPFLAPILAHPGWELQIVEGVSSCLGDVIAASFEVDHDGLVTWMEPHMPDRRVRLTAGELATIVHLDRLSCASPMPGHRYEVGWDRVGLSGDLHAGGGASIPPDSPAGQAIERLFEGVQARYVRDRRAALVPIVLDVVATLDGRERHPRRYQIHIANDRLTIRRGERTFIELTLDAAEVVKLVDWALATPAQPGEHGVGRGTLIIGSERHPIVFDRWDRSLLGIARTIEDKLACDENPLSHTCD